jgi:hypothetical protein
VIVKLFLILVGFFTCYLSGNLVESFKLESFSSLLHVSGSLYFQDYMHELSILKHNKCMSSIYVSQGL